MKNAPAPNRLAEHRKAKRLTQQELADLVGAHWITISKLERGVTKLSDEWRTALSAALDIGEWDLVSDPRPLPTAYVEGRIEEGGHIYEVNPDDPPEHFSLDTTYFTNPLFRWLVVAGDALWPWYQDGDKICVLQAELSELESFRGRICVAWYTTADGKEDVAIGPLERLSNAKKYTIARIGMPPLKNIEITAIAVVAMAVYDLGPWQLPQK